MKRVAGVGALISVAHSVYVYIRSREETPKSFQVGTVNDMILNRLKPGSILLYNRPWYEYYIPQAFAILLSKYLDGDDDDSFDHAGIFVEDDLGNPFVLELGPWGYVLTPYVSALMKTPANCIVLLPVHYSSSKDVEIRKRLYSCAEALSNSNKGSEILEIVSYALGRVQKKEVASPSYRFVNEVYGTIGVDMDASVTAYTITTPSLSILKSYMSGASLICDNSEVKEVLNPHFGQSTILRRQQ